MKLGIDLHNVRDGGGVNYVANLVRVFDPARHGFDEVHLFGARRTLQRIPDRLHVVKHEYAVLAKSLPHRLRFMLFQLDRELAAADCNVLFSPGGLYFGRFRPYATISRNMMPFDRQQWTKYAGLSFDRLRLHLLRRAHASTFRAADGMIFLTNIAREIVGAATGPARGETRVIPHGVDHQLFSPARFPARPEPPAADSAIRLIYPSRLEPYKHQVEVIEAVAVLRREFPRLTLEMYGPANPGYLEQVFSTMRRYDRGGDFVRYLGEVPGTELPLLYSRSHLLVFASACENLPNTLIEAMAFGIPIASSKYPPMPDVAGDAGLYFDPADPASIAAAIREAVSDWPATEARREAGLRRAAAYSWESCADQTFGFLRERVKDEPGSMVHTQ